MASPTGNRKNIGERIHLAPPPQKKESPETKLVDIVAVVRVLINKKFGSRIDELGLAKVEAMDNEIFHKIYLDKNKLKAAKPFIKKYGDSLTLDELYEVLPVFPWVYVKE